MAFNPDTGEWTDGFDTGTGKQSFPSASVASVDTPGQIDPQGNITTTLDGSPSGSQRQPEATPLPDAPTAPPQTPTQPPVETAATSVVNPADSLAYSPTSPSLSGTAATDPNMDALSRQRIIDLLNTPQTITPQSVAASPEAAAERLTSQRSTDRQLAQSAEQAAQNGTGLTGGQEGIQRGILQSQGERDSTFAGQLAGTLRQQQIGQLTQGIQFALQSGQFDKAQALQRQLAEMQAGVQNNQIGLGYANLQEQANRDAVIAALGGA